MICLLSRYQVIHHRIITYSSGCHGMTNILSFPIVVCILLTITMMTRSIRLINDVFDFLDDDDSSHHWAWTFRLRFKLTPGYRVSLFFLMITDYHHHHVLDNVKDMSHNFFWRLTSLVEILIQANHHHHHHNHSNEMIQITAQEFYCESEKWRNKTNKKNLNNYRIEKKFH